MTDEARKNQIREAMRALLASARGERDVNPLPKIDSPGNPPEAQIKTEIPRSQPKQDGSAKIPISLRLDSDVLEILRGSGPGWQTRLNAHLRHATGLDDGTSDAAPLRQRTKS